MKGPRVPPTAITRFAGRYFFLSNFYVPENGRSVEHRFQCCKAGTTKNHNYVYAASTPMEAKRRGNEITLRRDWERIKDGVMYTLVRDKFTKSPVLRKKLLATGDAHLEEGNDWGDDYWGTVNGKGENKLGEILMRIRDEIRGEDAREWGT